MGSIVMLLQSQTSSDVTHGSQIDATNTGVPVGRELTAMPASYLRITEAWITASNGGSRVLQDRLFPTGSSVCSVVDDFTFRYCKWSGITGFTWDPNNGSGILGNNTKFSYCEFDGNNEQFAGEVAFYGSEMSFDRCHIHSVPRGIFSGDNNLVVNESYFHDVTQGSGSAHLENLYVAGGAHLRFTKNKIIGNRVGDLEHNGMSAAFAMYNEGWRTPPFPSLDDIEITDNYFDTDMAYYQAYFGAINSKGGALPINMTVTGNIFGREYNRHGGMSSQAVAYNKDGSGNVWSNNKFGPRGPYWVSGDPEEGALIAAPEPM